MPRVCIHLDESTDWDYAKFFSGIGLEDSLVCLDCRRNAETAAAKLRTVSSDRFARIEHDGLWERGADGVIGQPQVLERPTNLSFLHQDLAPVFAKVDGIAAIRPIPSFTRSECILLTCNGDLFSVDLTTNSTCRLTNARDVLSSVLSPQRSLHVSPNGEMAAIVETKGRYGLVLDLDTGQPTMRLDRGGYRFKHSDFPVAFLQIDGQSLLVHGTEWNRLDVSDPRTGKLLTGRSPTMYCEGESRPEHYLDYFHGGLTVSPGGDWIVDNGWAWAPVGVIKTWSLLRWIGENPWESEDGRSLRSLCSRWYFWDGPLCWIDDRTLVVWGFGNDDEALIPAATVFDVESGGMIRWFAGPLGSFTFDGYLFSYSTDQGTSVWDVTTGERLLHDRSFCPTFYHPGLKQFISVLPGEGFRLSWLARS